MRTISMLVLMVLLSTGLAHAMEPMEGVPLRLVRDADALERAQKRKWRGKVLMAIGIVHWVGSFAAGISMARGFSCRLPSCRNEDFVSPIAAYTLLGTGAIFNGVGVPLYISGANELARNQSTPPAPPPALSLAF